MHIWYGMVWYGMVWYVYHTMYARYVTLACMNVQAIIDMHACMPVLSIIYVCMGI